MFADRSTMTAPAYTALLYCRPNNYATQQTRWNDLKCAGRLSRWLCHVRHLCLWHLHRDIWLNHWSIFGQDQYQAVIEADAELRSALGLLGPGLFDERNFRTSSELFRPASRLLARIMATRSIRAAIPMLLRGLVSRTRRREAGGPWNVRYLLRSAEPEWLL